MRNFNVYTFIIAALLSCVALQGYSQYMPVVFDREYGDGSNHYQQICSVLGGEVVMVGEQNGKAALTWLKRDGEVRSSVTLPGVFREVNEVTQIAENHVLVVGRGERAATGRKQEMGEIAIALVVTATGEVVAGFYSDQVGSAYTHGELLQNGDYLLAGYEMREGRSIGTLTKVSKSGKELYKHTATAGAVCTSFNVLGSQTDYIHAAFSAQSDSEYSSVVRLNTKGEVYFETTIPEAGFRISKMQTAPDGSVFLVGGSAQTGGAVVKLRPEGDVVFNKVVVPASAEAMLSHLNISDNGNLLVGGNNNTRGYCALLRNDGTALKNHLIQGRISGLGLNVKTGEVVIAGFDNVSRIGSIIGLTNDGNRIFERRTDGLFDRIKTDNNGIMLASSTTGRLCMLSNFGEVLFDRYAIEGIEQSFDDIVFTRNNDVLLFAGDNRLVKMGHGLYVSDVKIEKPVSGYVTARFTVTLTGYATNDQGAPVPVTVNYGTKEGTANMSNHFDAVQGSLSFVAANDGGNSYMIKQEIEVPVKANSYVEGLKNFELILSEVNQSYLIKSKGAAQIEDQEAIVKLVSTVDGQEAGNDMVYEIGLFKTNGEVLTNATGSEIWVDGAYGRGSADALDYDTGIIPRVTIAKNAGTGVFNVKTLSDTRYEIPKSVVVEFNNINALDGARVHFDGTLLSCAADIIDQPSMLAVTSLGDHGRMNNIVSGFYKISLLRASDGAVQTNATGADIVVECQVDGSSSAIEGRDFVFTNIHDLRISGDGNRSAVNLSGVVLYNADKAGDRRLVVNIDSVESPQNAPKLSVSSSARQAGFTVKKQ